LIGGLLLGRGCFWLPPHDVQILVSLMIHQLMQTQPKHSNGHFPLDVHALNVPGVGAYQHPCIFSLSSPSFFRSSFAFMLPWPALIIVS
jgi:hypothetical protein